MTKKPTTAAVADLIETTSMTPAEHAAQAGFTNWATVKTWQASTGSDEIVLILTTANGETDTFNVGSPRAEQVLTSYQAVYTTDMLALVHGNITLTEGASHE